MRSGHRIDRMTAGLTSVAQSKGRPASSNNCRFASSQSLLWSPEIDRWARCSAIKYARKRICSSVGGTGFAAKSDFDSVFLRARTRLAGAFFTTAFFTREREPFAL